jgi:hypothetical protein
MTKNELHSMIRKILKEELLDKSLIESANDGIYIIFSYYSATALDNFHLHGVYNNKFKAEEAICSKAWDKIQNFVTNHERYDEYTLACYLINPAEYKCDEAYFEFAVNSKYNSGESLLKEFSKIVYALRDVVVNKKSVFELTTDDIEMAFYKTFMVKNKSDFRFADYYLDEVNEPFLTKQDATDIFNNKNFEKFAKDKLIMTLNRTM